MTTRVWTIRCITCGAEPGEPCRSIISGRDVPVGHTRRNWLQNEIDKRRAEQAKQQVLVGK